MTNLRYQHLLATIRDLQAHTEAADRLSREMLKSGAIRDDLASHAIFEQLDARISASNAIADQIATQVPQTMEVTYD
jgi:hypothetical protein